MNLLDLARTICSKGYPPPPFKSQLLQSIPQGGTSHQSCTLYSQGHKSPSHDPIPILYRSTSLQLPKRRRIEGHKADLVILISIMRHPSVQRANTLKLATLAVDTNYFWGRKVVISEKLFKDITCMSSSSSCFRLLMFSSSCFSSGVRSSGTLFGNKQKQTMSVQMYKHKYANSQAAVSWPKHFCTFLRGCMDKSKYFQGKQNWCKTKGCATEQREIVKRRNCLRQSTAFETQTNSAINSLKNTAVLFIWASGPEHQEVLRAKQIVVHFIKWFSFKLKAISKNL